MQRLKPSVGLHKFNGGIPFKIHGTDALSQPLAQMPIPNQLILPIQQHIGQPADPAVNIGEKVLKGQVIANANSYISAPLHAPTSGTIAAIDEQAVAHPSAMRAVCITLNSDGEDRWITRDTSLADYKNADIVTLRNAVRDAGIVGLGGAAFPSAVKLNPGPHKPIHTLIINGAECEPYICCDEMLMQDRADDVIQGIQIVRHIIGAKQVIIGIEDSMPGAYAGLKAAIEQADDDFTIKIVPTIYPTGGEKQLIKVITGKEVPSNGLPADLGIVCHNPGTVTAVYRAIVHGEPLISRLLTITGNGVKQAQNVEALFGTSIKALIEFCGGYNNNVERVIMGGPMMGFALHSDNLPIVKATNCILVGETDEIHQPGTAKPCIRCGMCEQVCPVNLLPQQLYWYAHNKDFDKAQQYDLFDCIECGCCSYVCPSEIPLVQYYRYAKTEIANEKREQQKSAIARQRHESRNERLEREKQEREEKLRKKKEALAAKKKANDKPDVNPEIQAALDRVKAKKTAASDTGNA